MTESTVSPRDAQALPDSFDLSVIIERRPSSSPWVEYQWQLIGVSAMQAAAGIAEKNTPQLVFEQGGVARYQMKGFRLQLYADECESYYYNLISDSPRCFVMADYDDATGPLPVRVSLSFDEAHAYLEGDQEVYAVELPPELYRWAEAFVLAHYIPQKKTKRKLTDWSAQHDQESP